MLNLNVYYIKGQIGTSIPNRDPQVLSTSNMAQSLDQMEYDDDNVRLLLEEVDEDKSGLIDFEEFCGFLARVK